MPRRGGNRAHDRNKGREGGTKNKTVERKHGIEVSTRASGMPMNALIMAPVCGFTDGKWLISERMHSGARDVVIECDASVCDACLAHAAGPLAYAAGRTGAEGTVHGCDRWHRSDTWGFYVLTS